MMIFVEGMKPVRDIFFTRNVKSLNIRYRLGTIDFKILHHLKNVGISHPIDPIYI